MIKKSKKYNSRFIPPGYLKPYLDEFINELFIKGYSNLTIQGYYNSIAHFGAWIQAKSLSLNHIGNDIVSKFAKHPCHCYGWLGAHVIPHKYVARVRRFIIYLSQKNIIIITPSKCKIKPVLYVEKFKNSLRCRGLSEKTIFNYERYIYILLPLLGNHPRKYNAKQIRKIICDMEKNKSRCEIKKITTTLRVYLRFLTTEKICRPDLDAAVPTVAEWRLSSLPKYISINELERLILACNTNTPQGIRDRAIILLLSRLGLRAGDVSNMRMNDIDWAEGTLRVSGKGRREIILPLTQEVGDALLAYIKKARPLISINQLFLCLNAPYRPFPSSSGISSVVRAALSRAGISSPPSSGANLLRHTAATHMLRKGATLETVSAMLRHSSLDMTCYYAKVDILRLMQIAQPWPEGAPC